MRIIPKLFPANKRLLMKNESFDPLFLLKKSFFRPFKDSKNPRRFNERGFYFGAPEKNRTPNNFVRSEMPAPSGQGR